MKIARVEIAGTKPMNGVLPETVARRITRQVTAALCKTETDREKRTRTSPSDERDGSFQNQY